MATEMAQVEQQKDDETPLLTYRYLRMILVLPAVFLVLATIFEAWSRHWQFRESISDSYQARSATCSSERSWRPASA